MNNDTISTTVSNNMENYNQQNSVSGFYPGSGTSVVSNILGWPTTVTTSPSYNSYTNYPVQIRKVENGYLLWNSGKEYIFSNMKKLSEFLEKQDIK